MGGCAGSGGKCRGDMQCELGAMSYSVTGQRRGKPGGDAVAWASRTPPWTAGTDTSADSMPMVASQSRRCRALLTPPLAVARRARILARILAGILAGILARILLCYDPCGCRVVTARAGWSLRAVVTVVAGRDSPVNRWCASAVKTRVHCSLGPAAGRRRRQIPRSARRSRGRRRQVPWSARRRCGRVRGSVVGYRLMGQALYYLPRVQGEAKEREKSVGACTRGHIVARGEVL